jgi:hypothetical protein
VTPTNEASDIVTNEEKEQILDDLNMNNILRLIAVDFVHEFIIPCMVGMVIAAIGCWLLRR